MDRQRSVSEIGHVLRPSYIALLAPYGFCV